ncbi:MAG: methionyl-tRNA formyltransferase [Firmicutes bacterium]|nr:methionyl-tRNA formyltransferase [Bacillota bacterium]
MKIVYMGTPDFAVPPLEALHNAGYSIELAVTKADRARDRGKKVQFCPVKQKALELGIPVESPERVKGNAELLARLEQAAPDFIVVAAYGKILPKEILELPKYGCVNIHASLLPAYRGAAPIHRAVIDGCERTGVTIMQMEEGMDTGGMYAQESVEIGEKTTAQLHEELAELGARMIVETLPKIADGSCTAVPQDEDLASYAPMVFKEEGVIDFTKTAEQICCLVRGFNSWPTASTTYKGQIMKVHKCDKGTVLCHQKGPGAAREEILPGTVIRADKRGIEVACGGGSVLLTNIQMPGKKAMDVSAFLLGNKIEEGTVLGD